MTQFVGRRAELNLLQKRLDQIGRTGTGVAVAIRGRRQVGKSRLVQELCDRAGLPYLFFTAIKGASSTEATALFLAELAESTLPRERDLVPRTPPAGGWPDMLRLLAGLLPGGPCVVVLDELPWLSEQDETFDAALQVAWDRLLSRHPVLLLLLGSDLHMMQRMTAYDRPFYGRADTLVLGPLNPAETADALGLAAADALDAHLITGGLPGIVRRWPTGTPAMELFREECADPASPVFSVPEQSLSAEFSNPDLARRVLEAVGGGDRTFSNIAATAGSQAGALPSGTLSPLLQRLVTDKGVLAADEPLSTQPGRPALYRVADSNLRLYLAVLRDAQQQTRRGRPEAAFALVERRWATWRGRAIEPLVREGLELAAAAGDLPWPNSEIVGGWWNRRFDPEVDIVGADRGPVAGRIDFVGSVKWVSAPFDRRNLAALRQGAAQVPGFDPDATGLVAVSQAGADLPADAVDLLWGPADLLNAWPR
ncbi:ATP-binding protein [Polymorphospora sp. NPDC050346]|uniref:AAA family ATPase n=1 Tax=Polymorphospora sp. NPDC050346 TaxID=3155780 RepID=UPI0033F98A5E